MYFGPPCDGYALNCHIVYFANTRDTALTKGSTLEYILAIGYHAINYNF